MLLEEGLCCDQWVLLAKLCRPLPCFILYSKAKFASYSKCFLTSYFSIPVPYNKKDIFFGVFVLEVLVELFTNRDHFVIFETAPKDCTFDSFVDYEGCSNSSKGFLPIVVDIIVI